MQYKYQIKKIRFTSIFIILALNFCTAQNSINKELKGVMEKFSDSITADHYGMVGLYQGDGKTEKHAIGLAFEGEKMTTNKIFNIGSLTKMFTAVLVLQEVEKGNLQLNDRLQDYFPKEFCRNKNVDLKISIEDLLYHRSGVGEIIVDTLVNQAFPNPYFEYNHAFLFNKIPQPRFKRGEKYDYNNTNYILLGYILEVINDKPYADLLQERIFEPCKMLNSYAYFSKSMENIAHPHFNGEDYAPYIFHQYYKNYSFSAGGISSTVDDLLNFFNSLYASDILISQSSFQKMISFKDNHGLGIEQYSLGPKGKKVIYYGHGGDNVGFKVRNFYNPESGEILILMANQYKDQFISKVITELLYP